LLKKGEGVQHRLRRAGALPAELAYNQVTLMMGGVLVPANAAQSETRGFVAFSPSPAFPGTVSAPTSSAARSDLYLSRGVSALVFAAGKLFAGGSFVDAYREHGGGLKGASWQSQPSHFRKSPGPVSASVGSIIAFDGHAVSSLGLGVDGEVLALTVFQGMLIAGGSFTIARPAPTPRHHTQPEISPGARLSLLTGAIAQWHLTKQRWSVMPGLPPSGLPGVVHCLAADETLLYVGGSLELRTHLDSGV
jgi:hypothetical protein